MIIVRKKTWRYYLLFELPPNRNSKTEFQKQKPTGSRLPVLHLLMSVYH